MATDEHAAYYSGSGWPAGNRMIGWKWEVGSRPLAAGRRMSTARSRLLADGRRLLSARRSCFKYCFSYPYGYIRGSSATDASPWKTNGAGVAAQRTHSWSVATQYKITSLVTALSTSLWLAVTGAPENSSLATSQQELSLDVYTTDDHDANDLIGQCIVERVDYNATQWANWAQVLTPPWPPPPVNANRRKVWPHGELNGNWRVWAAMIYPVASRSCTCSSNYESAFLNGRKQQTWEHRKPYYNEIIVRHFRSCAGAETVKQITERRTVWIIHSSFTFSRAAARMLPHQSR